MIEFSQEELEECEKCIESIYIEKSVTFNNNPDPRIFSITKKYGYSMSIPYGLTKEKTEKYIDNQIQYNLTKEMNKIYGKPSA